MTTDTATVPEVDARAVARRLKNEQAQLEQRIGTASSQFRVQAFLAEGGSKAARSKREKLGAELKELEQRLDEIRVALQESDGLVREQYLREQAEFIAGGWRTIEKTVATRGEDASKVVNGLIGCGSLKQRIEMIGQKVWTAVVQLAQLPAEDAAHTGPASCDETYLALAVVTARIDPTRVNWATVVQMANGRTEAFTQQIGFQHQAMLGRKPVQLAEAETPQQRLL